MKTFAADRLPHTIECFSDVFFRRWFEEENNIDVFGRSVSLRGVTSTEITLMSSQKETLRIRTAR
jgi:hypothetical protein